MLELPNITIVSVNCISAIDSIRAINYSRREINFKEAILFTHEDILAEGIKVIRIDKLKSIDEYSDFMLRLADYDIDSDFVLIVQDDGFVLNANKWDPDWLNFDFCGAPWPKQEEWKKIQKASRYMDKWSNSVGNGGFSLRSRKFLQLSSQFKSCEGYSEDNFLCIIQQHFMYENGVHFPTPYRIRSFSQENNLIDWPKQIYLDSASTFGFHGHQFVNSSELINLKNR